jgi:hypothetical protein
MGLLVTTAMLAIYAVAAANVAFIERSYPLALAAAVSAIASAGTAYMQRWSLYLVHVLTTCFIAKWCWSIYDGWRVGYFGFRFGSNVDGLRSLLPGLSLVLLSAACSWMVHSHFSRANREGPV